MQLADVVIVGAGIAGASLGRALAEAGLGVVLLEASSVFEDRVRGEQMHVWGVVEARALGVEQVLLDAGAHVAPALWQYIEGDATPRVVPLGKLVPGVGGMLNVRHPDACQALLDAAVAAGAKAVRGVRNVRLRWNGPGVHVSFDDAIGQHAELATPLVVGADGRSSTVRKQASITLEQQAAANHITGLLLDGLEGVPDDHDISVAEGDDLFVLFHQGGGRARAYLMFGLSGKHRFTGPQSAARFLAATRLATYPLSERIAAATPAGPCATYPGDDTWTTTPFADGVVLIGDAAGYNDPIIGEGLSIAMRDARSVRDRILDGARKPEAFQPYGAERAARMRCLRLVADLVSAVHVEDGADRTARRRWFAERMHAPDAQLAQLFAAAFVGPEQAPPEIVDERILDQIRAV